MYSGKIIHTCVNSGITVCERQTGKAYIFKQAEKFVTRYHILTPNLVCNSSHQFWMENCQLFCLSSHYIMFVMYQVVDFFLLLSTMDVQKKALIYCFLC